MKKFFALQLILVFVLIQALTLYAQDSTIKTKNPAVKYIAPKYKAPVVFDHQHPPINKLVENVRYAYYRDKTDAQVAAIIYADRASYYRTLDRIYNDYDGKKGISKATFYSDIIKKYGNPFPQAKPAATLTAAQTLPKVPDTATKVPVVKPVAPADRSLNGQYQYLLSKLYNYQQPLAAAFRKNILDTLAQARKNLKNAQNQVTQQAKAIDSLKGVVKSASESANAAGDITLLGTSVDKGTYNLIMWGLVLVSVLIAVIVIARSGANRREARYRSQLYNELEEEYKNYKVKANEKEKKLARELQTERNKLDDMLGKN